MAQPGHPIRLAIVRQRYDPFGGAERFVEKAIDALSMARTPIELTVFAQTWPVDHAGAARCETIPVATSIRWLRDRLFARRLYKRLHAERFDLVQSHERIPGLDVYRAGDGVHAAWLERQTRALQGWRRWAKRLLQTLSPYHRYLRRQEGRMFRHPRLRAVICNSRLVLEEIEARFAVPAAKLKLIYNGVDTNTIQPAGLLERSEARSLLGLGPTEKVLLYVGSGFARKGVVILLRAIHQLQTELTCGHAERPPAVRCLVVGRERHLRRYRLLAQRLGIERCMLWCGAQPELAPYWAAADAFVLPTLYDPLPNAALEALAAGLPVFVTDACGVAELLTPDSGWVHAAGDAGRLAEQMRQWLADQSSATIERRRLAARAVADGLSLDKMTVQLTALYSELLDLAPLSSTGTA
ncbi:MAG: glycosyltransferase family 4 protein [Burkholderiaceae bacterium]